MDAAFRVERVEAGRFRLEGELDLGSVPVLAEAVEAEGGVRGDLVIEIDGLSFVDSSGVRGLLALTSDLAPDAVLVLRAPTPTVARVFDLMGLHHHPRLRVEHADPGS